MNRDDVPGLLLEIWLQESKSTREHPVAIPSELPGLLKENQLEVARQAGERAEDDLQKVISMKELEMIEFTWRDLLLLRKQKIDRAVARGMEMDESLLLPFEREYYSSLKEIVGRYHGRLDAVLPGKSSELLKDTGDFTRAKLDYILVYFKQPLEALVGMDMRVHGPFKKADVALLPKPNAEIVIRKRKAVAVSTSRPNAE